MGGSWPQVICTFKSANRKKRHSPGILRAKSPKEEGWELNEAPLPVGTTDAHPQILGPILFSGAQILGTLETLLPQLLCSISPSQSPPLFCFLLALVTSGFPLPLITFPGSFFLSSLSPR